MKVDGKTGKHAAGELMLGAQGTSCLLQLLRVQQVSPPFPLHPRCIRRSWRTMMNALRKRPRISEHARDGRRPRPRLFYLIC